MEIEAIRDAFLAWLHRHREECPIPDDECCEPLNSIAFIAHSAGVKVRHLPALKEAMMEYERKCPDCAHSRN